MLSGETRREPRCDKTGQQKVKQSDSNDVGLTAAPEQEVGRHHRRQQRKIVVAQADGVGEHRHPFETAGLDDPPEAPIECETVALVPEVDRPYASDVKTGEERHHGTGCDNDGGRQKTLAQRPLLGSDELTTVTG